MYTYEKTLTGRTYTFETLEERERAVEIDRLLSSIAQVCTSCDLSSPHDVNNVVAFITQRTYAIKKVGGK
jgi:hypothetical protein